MIRRCDHPVEIAILRRVMQEPQGAFTQASLAQAVAWLGDAKVATTKGLRDRLNKLVEKGLLRRRDDPNLGPLWSFERGSSVTQATGGIDPLTTTPEEVLTAFSWRSGRAAEFDPQAHKRAPEGTDRIERALRQVTSPWQYAERIRRL